MALFDLLTGDSGGNNTPQPVSAPPQSMDNASSAFNFLIKQGFEPHQAAGIVGNLQGESSQGLNPNAVNRGDGRDGSDSIGIGQWNGPRAAALRAYADSKGTPWNDLNTQLEFLHSELKGPESKAYSALMAAKTPEEAGRAFMAYERPKDWNVEGSHPERAQYARSVFNKYGGGQQVAQNAPASPAANPAAHLQPPQSAPPIFSQAQPQHGGGSLFAQMPVEQTAAPPPIFAPPRKPIDLSRLQAALQASGNRGFFYGQGKA